MTLAAYFFFLSFFLGVVYYGMYAATAGVLWSVRERQGGGVTMTTGLLRGLGLLVERGRSVHAMSLYACLVMVVYVRTRVCGRARGGGGGGRLSIMVCSLRGNYAESCVSVGGGIIMGCLPPLCVCEVVS